MMSSDSPDYLRQQSELTKHLTHLEGLERPVTVHADGSITRAKLKTDGLILEGIDPNDPMADLAFNIHSLNFILGRITQSEFANRILKIWPTLPFMDLCKLVQTTIEEKERFMDEAIKRG